MDTVAEQLVEKKRTGADWAKMVLIAVGALLLSSFIMFLAIFLMFFTLIIPAVLILFGAVWLLSGMNVEYEYIITNNEMDIDKVIGRRKRKRMITLDLSNAEEFAAYPSENDVQADVTVHASSGLEKDAHYLVVNHSGYGKVNLIFNPNEKIREAIMQGIPNSLRIKIVHNVKS